MIKFKFFNFDNFTLIQHKALKDNYNYILKHNLSQEAILFDPSQGELSLQILSALNLKPAKIFITHHHPDHVGGVKLLKENFDIPVYAFDGDFHRIPNATKAINDGQKITWNELDMFAKHLPGHTTGLVVYHIPSLNILVSGDLIFTLGCGRLFEGSYEELLSSMHFVRSLPAKTLLCSSHEYTFLNVPFALKVDPNNEILKQWIETAKSTALKGDFVVPNTLAQEKLINPFLRYDDINLKTQNSMPGASDIEFITYLRKTRDVF